ncbi:MAG: hemolysin family protein [Planctomycetota bacterium]
MTSDVLAPVGMTLLMMASSLVSGSETAVFSLRPMEVERLVASGSRLGALVQRLLIDVPRTLLAILLFNNLVNITFFAVAGWWAAQQGGDWAAVAIPIGSLMALIAFGEVVPKVLASTNPPLFTSLLAPLLYALVLMAHPVCRVIEALLPWIQDEQNDLSVDSISDAELKHVIQESHQQGVVSEQAHDRLLEIIDLSQTPVYEVMTHRVDCPSVRETEELAVAVSALAGAKVPYVLVVDDNEDCVGVLMAQDLLRGGTLSKRMRKPMFLPEGTLLPNAINAFQNSNATMAVVVDEYGGTAGLLTLAHIGQALLGEGRSEDLPDIEEPEQLTDATWRISGQMPVDIWEDVIDAEDLAGCTTIGGFVTRGLGSVPERGDRLLYRNLQFEVSAVANHRIATLLVRQLAADEARRLSQVHRK